MNLEPRALERAVEHEAGAGLSAIAVRSRLVQLADDVKLVAARAAALRRKPGVDEVLAPLRRRFRPAFDFRLT